MSARISLMLLAAMGCLPFLLPHHLEPIPSFAGEWLAVALGLLAAVPLLLRRYWQPLHFPVIVFVPLGLMAVAAVQAVAGIAAYWQQHMLVALYLAWAALMMVLGSALRHEVGLEKLVPVVAWGVLASGAISAVIVGLQMAGIEPVGWIFPHGRSGFSANLAQPNQLADLFGLSLASLLYLLATDRLGRISSALLALAMLVALALTGARSGWLYVVALVMLTVFFRRRNPENIPEMLLPASLVLIAVFAALQWLIPILHIGGVPMMPSERIVALAQGESIRLQLLEVAWRTFSASPLLGAGIGQFAWHDFMLADTVKHTAGMATHAHNLIAHLLAETGLAGTLVVLAGVGFWLLFQARRAAFSMERWWLLALLGVLFIHSMLEYPLWYAYFLGLAALLLGMGEEKTLQCRVDSGPVVVAALVAFGALSLVNLGANERKLEHWFAVGKTGKLGDAQLEAFAQDVSSVRRKSLLAPYADTATAIVLQLNRQEVGAKLAVTQQATRYSPTSTLVYKQAALLALGGQRSEALAQLHRALARHPAKAKEFHRHIFRLVLKGEIRMLPLLMVVQEHLPPAPAKLKHSSSGKIPDAIRENTP